MKTFFGSLFMLCFTILCVCYTQGVRVKNLEALTVIMLCGTVSFTVADTRGL